MALIYETENFILESHENPEVDRLEGGHMKISPKVSVEDRTFLTPRQAIELMRFTIASGEAMKRAMAKIGVHIGRINYQDNGNWRPELHVHLYGRAIDATMQNTVNPSFRVTVTIIILFLMMILSGGERNSKGYSSLRNSQIQRGEYSKEYIRHHSDTLYFHPEPKYQLLFRVWYKVSHFFARNRKC